MQNEYWATYAITAFLENFWYLIVAAFGAIVGSFLGVVIYRLPIIELTPREELPPKYSLSNPPSYCPHCNHKLSSWENVPIFGFLWLGGRCHDCKKPIPWRDFAMEILTASAWVAIFHRYNGNNLADWVNVILIALFASVLIAAVFIDLDHFIVPDALNRTGMVIGLVRDVAVLGIAYLLAHVMMPDGFNSGWNGPELWKQIQERYTYFGWLPRGFVGAAVYAGILWVISFLTYLYYARAEGESLPSVARRFFTSEEAPVIEQEADPTSDPLSETVTPQVAAEEEGDAEEEEGSTVRLRFSPGFITILSAGFLAIVVGWWSLLAVILPVVAFIALTRTKTESVGDAFKRFFKSNDLPYEYEAPSKTLGMPTTAPAAPVDEPMITGSNIGELLWNKTATIAGTPETVPAVSPSSSASLSFAEAQADADQFARDAETGAHGGMGLGDVKLAIAIGAILGPGQAVLSLVFATFLGAITGIILKSIHRKEGLKFGVPFVPFMAAGAFICLLFGEPIVTWYTNLYSGNPQTVQPAGNFSNSNMNRPRVMPGERVQLPSDDQFVPGMKNRYR